MQAVYAVFHLIVVQDVTRHTNVGHAAVHRIADVCERDLARREAWRYANTVCVTRMAELRRWSLQRRNCLFRRVVRFHRLLFFFFAGVRQNCCSRRCRLSSEVLVLLLLQQEQRAQ
jgi:hypothetical protein